MEIEQHDFTVLRKATALAYSGIQAIDAFELVTADGNNQFLAIAQNALLEKAVLTWCHLFGAKNSQVPKAEGLSVRHILSKNWYVASSSLPDQEAKFNSLLDGARIDYPSYEHYRNQLKDIRHEFLAHKKVKTEVACPDLSIAKSLFISFITTSLSVLSYWNDKRGLEAEELKLMRRLERFDAQKLSEEMTSHFEAVVRVQTNLAHAI